MSTISIWSNGRRLLAASTVSVLAVACATAPAEEVPVAAAEMSVEAIHERALVLDAHADIVLPSTSALYLASDGQSKVAPSKLEAGGVDAVVMAVAVGPGPRTAEGDAAARAETDEKLAAVQALVASSPEALALARSADEITATVENGQIALILGFQNARAFGGDVDSIDVFYEAGVRVFGFNHIGHNDFSDSSRPVFISELGAYEPAEEHNGLSELGVAAVERINALGGVIDVSQMSKAATLDVLDLSTAPIIATHSNARTLSNVSRNLSDEEIDRIGETGGVIHIASFGAYLIDLSDEALLAEIDAVRSNAGLPAEYSYPYELYWEIEDEEAKLAFLGSMRAVLGPSSVGRMVDHIDYVVERIGIDHVGVGTDFNHGGGIGGFTDASEAMNVTAELVKRGYSEEDIGKIWGGNFLRVLRAAEEGASSE